MIPNKSDPEVPIGDESKAKTVFEAPFTSNPMIKEYRTAEDIVKSWRSVLYPRRSAGGKSYSLIGESYVSLFFSNTIFQDPLLIFNQLYSPL